MPVRVAPLEIIRLSPEEPSPRLSDPEAAMVELLPAIVIELLLPFPPI